MSTTPRRACTTRCSCPKAWRDKYKGKFDQGWDKYREEILARQKKLGIVPPNTQLTPKPDIAPDWDTLSADEKKVCIRYQEVFAAFAELTDYEIGRVVQAVEDMGALDNTLIIYVTGDNGASPNGGRIGVFNTMSTFNQVAGDPGIPARDPRRGRRAALRDDAAGRLVDRRQHAVRVFATPYAIWRHHQCRDRLLAEGDQGERRDTQPVPPRDRRRPDRAGGGGLAAAQDGQWRRAKAHRRREHAQLLHRRAGEVGAHGPVLRGLREPRHLQGWMVRRDPAQGVMGGKASQLLRRGQMGAVQHGGRLQLRQRSCPRSIPTSSRRCRRRSSTEAVKYNVLPLDDRAQERFNATMAGRPDFMGGRTSLALYPGMIGMKENAFIDVKNRSSSITAELEIPQSGASGVILAQGGAHSGWSLYVKDGKPKFAYNFLGDGDDHRFRRAPARRPCHAHLRFCL